MTRGSILCFLPSAGVEFKRHDAREIESLIMKTLENLTFSPSQIEEALQRTEHDMRTLAHAKPEGPKGIRLSSSIATEVVHGRVSSNSYSSGHQRS